MKWYDFAKFRGLNCTIDESVEEGVKYKKIATFMEETGEGAM